MIDMYCLQACDNIHQEKDIVILITLLRMGKNYNIQGSAVQYFPKKKIL